MSQQRTNPTFSELGLAEEDLRELLEGPEEGLLGRIIRLNQQPQYAHRLNVVMVFNPVLDHYRAIRGLRGASRSSSTIPGWS
jgi:hypothetical protein